MYKQILNFLNSLLGEIIKVPLFFQDQVDSNINTLTPLFKNELWFALLKEFILLILMIVIPIVILKQTRKWSKKLSSLRKRAYYTKKNRFQNFISQFASHYMTWVMMIITFIILDGLLRQTAFVNWSFVFHFLIAFGVYQLVVTWLNRTFIKYKVSYIEHNKKAKATIFLWCTYLLTYYLVTDFILITIKEGIIFKIINFSFLAYGVFFFIRSCYRWREETYKSLANIPYIGGIFGYCQGKKWALFLLPLLSPLAFIKSLIDLFISFFSDLEFFQRLSNRIVKDKLKDAIGQNENASNELPLTYSYLFDHNSIQDSRLTLNFPNNLLDECLTHISEWIIDREEEHSLAIIGPIGSGKSAILKQVSAAGITKSTYETRYICLSQKVSTSFQLNKILSKVLGDEFQGSLESLIEIDEKLSPTVIVIDNAHNAFLAKEDGLEGLKYFISLINAQTKNLFWVTAFNSHSWFYISNVLGRHRYFRHEIMMPRWTQEDITSLIKKRHSFSDYNLSFDLISEILSQDEESLDDQATIEAKYYRLLSEQAKGKPGLALSLWITSLRAISYQKLQVALPSETNDTTIFNDMQDHSLFIFSALLRHENLTLSEAADVTSLPKGIVANSFKLGMERKFLMRDNNQRYRVVITKIDALTTFLAKKNFIYE